MIIASQSLQDNTFLLSLTGLKIEFKNIADCSQLTGADYIIIGSNETDLSALPEIKRFSSAPVTLFVDSDLTIHIGKSINTLIKTADAKIKCMSSGCQCQTNITTVIAEPETVAELFTNTDQYQLLRNGIYIIGAAYRPGVPNFLMASEQYCEAKDIEFDVFVMMYGGMKYIVIGFGTQNLNILRKIAKKCRLKIVQGKPRQVGGDVDAGHFPLAYAEDSIYTLESNAQRGDLTIKQLKQQLQREYQSLK